MYIHVCGVPPVDRDVVDPPGQGLLHLQAGRGGHILHHDAHHTRIAHNGLAAGFLLGEVVQQFGGLRDGGGVSALLPLLLLEEDFSNVRQGLSCELCRSLLGVERGGREGGRE